MSADHSTLWFSAQRSDLAGLKIAARARSLLPRSGKDFSSNDYLGLAGCDDLAEAARAALARGVPVGSGGSRLLRGNHEEHEKLEDEAARFFGTESALYFSAGFAANSALLSTLPQRGDLIVADELIHASAHEGLRLGRSEYLFARHNDVGHFDDLASAWRRQGNRGQIWFAVESLYSMDGNRAPIDELVALADRYHGILLIDEAHAAGVFGARGRGLAEDLIGRANVIKLVTCGKALGCEGALICGPRAVRDFLINRGRSFIFSTAPSPLMAAVTRSALAIIATQPSRRERLWRTVALAEEGISKLGLAASGSQVIPIILGDDRTTMDAALRLQGAGIDVRGIRPPTVPEGTSRLRVSITLNVTDDDVSDLCGALEAVLAGVRQPA